MQVEFKKRKKEVSLVHHNANLNYEIIVMEVIRQRYEKSCHCVNIHHSKSYKRKSKRRLKATPIIP